MSRKAARPGFPQAGIRVAPKRGLLLAWNNMNPDGSPNTLTLHEGMPVVEGREIHRHQVVPRRHLAAATSRADGIAAPRLTR